MSEWNEFTKQLVDALRRFVQGDAEPRSWNAAGTKGGVRVCRNPGLTRP